MILPTEETHHVKQKPKGLEMLLQAILIVHKGTYVGYIIHSC